MSSTLPEGNNPVQLAPNGYPGLDSFSGGDVCLRCLHDLDADGFCTTCGATVLNGRLRASQLA